jgi:hypothetical protein
MRSDFRVWAIAAVVVVLPEGLAAAATGGVEPFLACARLTDDARRLACFDAEVARLAGDTPAAQASGADSSSEAVATAGAATAATAAADASPKADSLTSEEKFGLRGDLKKQKTPELQQLTANVTGVAERPWGELVVTLDNGQIWVEIESDSGVRLKAGDQVTIKTGALHSYLLTAPNGRSSKVRRLE